MSHPLKAAARPRAARRPAPCRDLQRQLNRFGRPVRPAVQCLAARHSRLADLAFSFPALLVALAVPRLGFRPAGAIAAVIEGKPLAHVAALASVPLWLRKLPPQSFAGALPVLPQGDLFRRQIGNYLPKRTNHALAWLAHVAHASAVAHEPYALWIARILAGGDRLPRYFHAERVGVWAWHSLHEGGASALIETRWSPTMDWQAAKDHASRWISAIEFHCAHAQSKPPQAWLWHGEVDGLEFVHLQSFADLVEEGRVMKHCVGSYGESLADGTQQFWSVRHKGRRVATVALDAHAGDKLVRVSEIRGSENAHVPREVAFAVRRWLNSHDVEALVQELTIAPYEERLKAANKLWTAYRLAKRGFPSWLPAHDVHWL